ncbi:MAG: BMP family ABC transporter substrate-binding protein [Candidatus Nanopelagicales bacterium]|nr:BMP family ABC transporter substrate-binding protein [Candidatus Nanopelagicales bacterium]
MFKRTSLVSAFLVGAIALTGCGSDSGTEATPSEAASSPAAASDVKVGLAYDIGGRGDQSFNDAAAKGLDQAKTEFGVETKELEAGTGETDAQKEERLRLLAEGGYNPVIAVGFAYAGPLGKVAAEFPDTKFAIVDDASEASTAPNIANLVFAENEGSYLVGVIAAQASEAGKIGFVGGVNTPLIKKFEVGYEAGAKSINPDIEIDVKYLTEPPDFSGFTDPAKGKTAAEGMFQGGADVVYHAAGGSGSGVFQAAKAAEGWAIGVDSDQYLTAGDDVKDVIVTSMLKAVDVAVFKTVEAAVNGSPLTGVQTFDLKSDGVGYSLSNPAVSDFTAKADEAKAAIIDGSVTVPSS